MTLHGDSDIKQRVIGSITLHKMQIYTFFLLYKDMFHQSMLIQIMIIKDPDDFV